MSRRFARRRRRGLGHCRRSIALFPMSWNDPGDDFATPVMTSTSHSVSLTLTLGVLTPGVRESYFLAHRKCKPPSLF